MPNEETILQNVSRSAERRILDFLNTAETAGEIAGAVELPRVRDVGVRLAQRLLDAREDLGEFSSLAEVAAVPLIGPKRLAAIVETLAALPRRLEVTRALALNSLSVEVDLSETQARVQSEYLLENCSRSPLTVELSLAHEAEPQLRAAALGAGGVTIRQLAPRVEHGVAALALEPRERQCLEELHTEAVLGHRTKDYLFLPLLQFDGALPSHELEKYKVSFRMPKSAKRIIATQPAPTSIRKTDSGVVYEFSMADSFPLPISIKWTELDVDVSITKEVHRLTGGEVAVTLTTENHGQRPTPELLLEEDYSAGDIEPVAASTVGASWQRTDDREPRLVYRARLTLGAGAKDVRSYTFKARRPLGSVPGARVTVGGELVAAAPTHSILLPGMSPPSRKVACVIPSGWSFDFKPGFLTHDHCLNEHGLWVMDQDHSPENKMLYWSTECVFADKNFDDPYSWWVMHYILELENGFVHHGSSDWLDSAGGAIVDRQAYASALLRNFSQVVVLPRGWHFDFKGTGVDRHINEMKMSLKQSKYGHATGGAVSWRMDAQYADKNFDDPYRFRYFYTVLGYNGVAKTKRFSGRNARGSCTDTRSVTLSAFKRFSKVLVIPMGWRFKWDVDGADIDRWMDQHQLVIRELKGDSSVGRVSWNAHLNYRDCRPDEDYEWWYRVLLIGCNDVRSAAREEKALECNAGGFDSYSFESDLDKDLQTVTWTNGIKDGNETGVDCGGSSPARDLEPIRKHVNSGQGPSARLFSLWRQGDHGSPAKQKYVRHFADTALETYAKHEGVDYSKFYSGPKKPDRYVEAIAWYVDENMEYAYDGVGGGATPTFEILRRRNPKGGSLFRGDCEEFAVLRAALLRSLGFHQDCIFCADHHESVDQGQDKECYGAKKGLGHTFNIVVYKGKYRIMDYGPMKNNERYWSGKRAWRHNVTDNIWNDHYGEHWKQNVNPLGVRPLVNYPGNPVCPSPNWDWRTYFCDVTL